MKAKLLMVLALLLLLISVFVFPSRAAEKVNFGSPVKRDAALYLPNLAAEEKGFWKENALEVEWIPFSSGTALVQAVAAGEIKIGMHASSAPPVAAERGLPVVMVAELASSSPFILWVKGDSPYRQPRDLKGKRIGVAALGSAAHVFGRLIVKAHGMEKDVRFVGGGSSLAMLAGLKVGSLEALVTTLSTIPGPKAEGMVRELASAADYLPKPWVDLVIFVRKEYAQSKPDVVRKLIRATVQATDFIRKNRRWALDKMKSFEGLTEEAARAGYESIQFTTTGRLDRKAVENVRRVFLEYGILTEKAPAVDDLFTNEYYPG